MAPLGIVFCGLSITSSWGNGHATNYRALLRALDERGHSVLFLERDAPWYAGNRDLPSPPWGRTELYGSIEELRDRFAEEIRDADAVVVGSYVPEGRRVVDLVLAQARGRVAFYDIDTPVTVAALERDACEYLAAAQVPRFDLYLSFTGGPLLRRLERELGANRALPFHCLVDAAAYRPLAGPQTVDLGYLGTYSDDRQRVLERLLLEPARRLPQLRFAVAGPQYPQAIAWPPNVERTEHLAPAAHPGFYSSQRFTLNVTRHEMVRCGWSPSVRLFEAAACGTPIVSDWWPGLDSFLAPGREILVAGSAADVVRILRETPERERLALARSARARVLAEHTAEHRAVQLEAYLQQVPARAAARA